MGRQSAAEQLGIGFSENDVHLLAEQAVDEEMPTLNILYLIIDS